MFSIRQKIVDIAKHEAMPPPYGKVSDILLDHEDNRAGWRVLKDYFEQACRFTELHWKQYGRIRVQGIGDWKQIQFIDGVKKPKMRVPQGNQNLREYLGAVSLPPGF